MTSSPFKYFKTSPEIIRLAVMLYVRFRVLGLQRLQTPRVRNFHVWTDMDPA